MDPIVQTSVTGVPCSRTCALSSYSLLSMFSFSSGIFTGLLIRISPLSFLSVELSLFLYLLAVSRWTPSWTLPNHICGLPAMFSNSLFPPAVISVSWAVMPLIQGTSHKHPKLHLGWES